MLPWPVVDASLSFSLYRCCRCLSLRCRLCVAILRPESAPSSASPRLLPHSSCSQLKSRSLCRQESQVPSAIMVFKCVHEQNILACINIYCGSTGHEANVSQLHVLHGDPAAQTWTDITSQVSLYVTHLYAIFYITHFSW